MNDQEKAELRRLAEEFPSDLDWDSNTEPFFNGPSGESLGGGSDGTYCVYGKPFFIDGDDYEYDGPTYVERCGKDFAKFIVSSKGAVLSLLDECDKAEAEREAALAELAQIRNQLDTVTGWYSNSLDVIREVTAAIPGVTYMDPPDGGDVSIPDQIRRMAKDAERYRWLRDKSSMPSVVCTNPQVEKYFNEYMMCGEVMDKAIDSMAKESGGNER